MIEIKKIKYWYGIKNLKNPGLIKGNTIIYSPNGVMKTSFADGIRDLKSDNNPRDIFNNIDSEYEILNNGISVTELSKPKNIDAIVFSGTEINDEIYSDPRIAKLMISKELKKEYQVELKKTEGIKKKFWEIISKGIAKDLKVNESTIKLFIPNLKGIKEVDSIIEFIDSIGSDIIKEDISKIKYVDLFGEKTQPILNDPEFVIKCEAYNSVILDKFDKLIFKGEFTFDNLISIKEQLTKLDFFNASHSINLLDKKYDEKELTEYINQVTKHVYESEEVKRAYDEAKKILGKKTNQNLKKIIESYPWILKMLSNVTDLKKKIINTNAAPFMEELNKIKNELLCYKKNIKDIIEKSSEYKTDWENVLVVYNQRFINKNVDLVINNSPEAILDVNIPIIEKKLKNSNRNITSDIHKRFSSGEKRAIYILSLLYEIEVLKIEGKKFTIILDDVVDSFDYKNKYSMIEYLKELSNNPNIQLIILTHNFDFYRSCRITLEKGLESKLLAYEVLDGIELINAKNKEFENFSFIKNWKSQGKTKSMIALLPFIRNLYEIKEDSKDPNYKEICHFLHYDNKIKSLNLMQLNKIFDEFNVKRSDDYSKYDYFSTLNMEVDKVLSEKITEDKLLEKILLGIFIRLSSDKILLDRYVNEKKEIPIISGNNWTRGLYNLTYPYLTEEEKKLYNKSITIAPSFLHVNGFMYEPLVDVGLDRMIELVGELKSFLNI